MKDIRKTRAIIDLDVLAQNYRLCKSMAGEAEVAAVVKADAYGHGALPVSKRLAKEGCKVFCVATIDEAITLREAGIDGCVLILGYVLEEYLPEAVKYGVSLAVDDFEHIKAIAEAADGKPVNIHIKLDTGMNRTGFAVKETAFSAELGEVADFLHAHPNIRCEGLFSHFAVSDEPDGKAFTKLQYKRFCASAKAFEEHGIVPKYKHICNSGGIVWFPEMHLNMVRMGIILYGCGGLDQRFAPAMQCHTTVVNVHTVKAGEPIGYGCSYVPKTDKRIAIIGAGYADGLKRCLSHGKGYVLIHGKKAPFVGNICMDMAMVDVSEIDGVKVEDNAVIFGKDGEAFLSVDEVARNAGTIGYEILCAVAPRVPRLYVEKEQ